MSQTTKPNMNKRITHLEAISTNLALGNIRAAQGQARQYVALYPLQPDTFKRDARIGEWFKMIDRAADALAEAIKVAVTR
jgi:hypothetical protein